MKDTARGLWHNLEIFILQNEMVTSLDEYKIFAIQLLGYTVPSV